MQRKENNMAQIKSEAAYRAALKRIDELLPLVNDETPTDDKNYLEAGIKYSQGERDYEREERTVIENWQGTE